MEPRRTHPANALYRMDSIITPRHHSGTGCIDGIGHATGRVDPRGRKWVITHQRPRCEWPNFHWECDTDVPIWLFAYVGINPPWKKRGTHEKRGVVFHHGAEVYFPFWFISCQNEAGEITHHTFTWQVPSDEGTFDWRPPGDNVLFWWRCGGRTTKWVWPFQPIWSASRSPFYNFRCKKPPHDKYEFTPCDPHETNRNSAEDPDRCGQTFLVHTAHFISSVNLWVAAVEYMYPSRVTVEIVQCDAEGRPNGAILASDYKEWPAQYFEGGAPELITFNFAPALLAADTLYAIRWWGVRLINFWSVVDCRNAVTPCYPDGMFWKLAAGTWYSYPLTDTWFEEWS